MLMQSFDDGAILIYFPPIASQASVYSCPLTGAMMNTCVSCIRKRSAIVWSRKVFPAPVVP